MSTEIRCIALVPKPRYRGERCGHFVTRAPAGYRLHLVGMVAHSSLADPEHHVFACTVCGRLHELREEAVANGMEEAA